MTKKKNWLAPLIVCISLLLLVGACACIIYFGFINDDGKKDRDRTEETSKNTSEEDSSAESDDGSTSEEDSSAESDEDESSVDSEEASSATESEETEEGNDTESSIADEIIPDIEGKEYIGTWNAVGDYDHDRLVINADHTCLIDDNPNSWVYQNDLFVITNYEYGDNVVCTNVNNGFLTIVREGFQIEGSLEYPMEFEVYAKSSSSLGDRYIDERLIGVWEGGFNALYESYAFNADGTGFHNPDLYNVYGASVNNPITWYVENGTLLITENGQTEAIGYAFGHYLYLDTFVKFYEKKEATVVTSPYVGTWMNAREGTLEKLVMYENGNCVLYYEDFVENADWYINESDDTLCIDSEGFYDSIYRAAVHNDAVLQIDSYNGSFVFVRDSCYGNLTGDIHSGLVGSWSGSGGSGVTYYDYTFNSNGTGIYKEHNFYGETTTTTTENISWFVNGDVLTVESATETVYYVYELDGDRLECYTTDNFPDFNLIFSRQ